MLHSRPSSYKRLYSTEPFSTLVEPKQLRLTLDSTLNFKNLVNQRKEHRKWERQYDNNNKESEDKGGDRILDRALVGKRKRNNQGYDPNTSRESQWYKDYVSPRSDRCLNVGTKHAKKFRRRFRMPMASFRYMMNEARRGNWFPDYEKVNALGQVFLFCMCMLFYHSNVFFFFFLKVLFQIFFRWECH
jgi:hypothetical protein